MVALVVVTVLWVRAASDIAGRLGCPAPTSELSFGEYEWSWWPMGRSCSWTRELNGIDARQRPTWPPTILGVVAGATGSLLVLGAIARSSTARSRPERRGER